MNDDQIDLEHQNYLIIGTLESYLKIRDYFGKEKVVPIYIEVEDGERLSRALNRERGSVRCKRFFRGKVKGSRDHKEICQSGSR